MKLSLSNSLKALAVAATIGLVSTGQAVAAVDIVQTPTNYFVPTDAQKYDSPYYRGGDEDWVWKHNALSVTTSASLLISAFDVDFSSGEVDNIYGKTSVGSWALIGALGGADDQWAFTTFNLGSDWFDEIQNGLELMIDIDSVYTYSWVVTLAKSQLCVDETICSGNPNPGTVPEPASLALMGLGLAGLAALRRRKTV